MSSSQYHTCIASLQPRGSAKASRINSTHPPSGPAGSHRLRKRNSRSCAQALVLTGAPDCPESALDRGSVTRCGAWLRPAKSHSPYKTRQTCQRDKATGQDKQKNKRIQRQTTSNRNTKRASHGGGCDVGACGPLQSLVTSVS